MWFKTEKVFMEKIISVENLTFGYEKQLVLNDVSFSIAEGDFVAIIGSNGTGKSTLIKLLLGELFPVFGNISILGKGNSNSHNLLNIGYVPQVSLDSNSGFPATVKEIVLLNLFSAIGFMRFPKKKHKEQVLKTLEMVEMEQCANCQIGNLSGGQQQRVWIAKALVSNPKIIILDEPTTGIDTHSTEILLRLLTRLNKEQKITILMITHDINKISQHINRTLRLSEGSINEDKVGE